MEEKLMKNIVKRFLNFAKNEKTHKYWAVIFYFYFIISISVTIPAKLKIIYNIFAIFIYIFGIIYYTEYLEKAFPMYGNPRELCDKIVKKIIKVFYELLMYIPIWFLFVKISGILINGIPENQNGINEMTNKTILQGSTLDFISLVLMIVIFGPILEEFVFRVLPYKFIKNKVVYIIFSSFVFAGMHVINDPKWYYYIWCYILNPIYYAYRYHKTKDIWVPVSMHIFNNFIATLPIILAYF